MGIDVSGLKIELRMVDCIQHNQFILLNVRIISDQTKSGFVLDY